MDGQFPHVVAAMGNLKNKLMTLQTLLEQYGSSGDLQIHKQIISVLMEIEKQPYIDVSVATDIDLNDFSTVESCTRSLQ